VVRARSPSRDTPDGRPGWATFLLESGYAVYVVDRPGHGRSSFHPDVLGPMGGLFTFELASALFTDAKNGLMSHPTAELHSQWPGSGKAGDPSLDQFVASMGPMLGDTAAAHALEQERGAALLDEIGPAILITHSAGGPMGWLIADAHPELVKALVAIETLGPPFMVNPDLGLSLPWGLTAAPIGYEPPAASPDEIQTEVTDTPMGPLTLQAEPARKLPNLAQVPIAFVDAEASLFAHASGATIAFQKQAGCDVERISLADHGVHGNGHLMMLERNNREALAPILDWLERTVD
jgi:pimeloyl-ACP methyl ester carboxylesterase